MKYVVATIASLAILFVYALIGAGLNWRHAGGFFGQAILWSSMIGAWVWIVRVWPDASAPKDASTMSVDGMQAGRYSVPGVASTATLPPPAPIDDEPFYATAQQEIASNTMRDGLWGKAFSECEGDERRTQAMYIKLRVAQLTGEVAKSQAEQLMAAQGGGAQSEAASRRPFNTGLPKKLYLYGALAVLFALLTISSVLGAVGWLSMYFSNPTQFQDMGGSVMVASILFWAVVFALLARHCIRRYREVGADSHGTR